MNWVFLWANILKRGKEEKRKGWKLFPFNHIHEKNFIFISCLNKTAVKFEIEPEIKIKMYCLTLFFLTHSLGCLIKYSHEYEMWNCIPIIWHLLFHVQDFKLFWNFSLMKFKFKFGLFLEFQHSSLPFKFDIYA